MKPSNEKLLTSNINTRQTEVKMIPPDGGWGWMIVLASVIILILGALPNFAYGIIFSPLLMSKGVSATKVAWIFNLHSLTYSIYTLFVGPACEHFKHRKVALFGGITTFIAMILSAFAPTPDFLFFSFSLIGGIGGSSTLNLCFLIVSLYFKKHRGLALGITACGASMSSFVAPILSNYLLEHFGYRGASLIFAAIGLNQCVGAMLYQPVEWHMKKAKLDDTTEILLDEKNADERFELEESHYAEAVKTQSNRQMNSSSKQSSDLNFESVNHKPNYKDDKTQQVENRSFLNLSKRVLISTYRNLKKLKYIRVQFIGWAFGCLTLGYINFGMWIPFIVTSKGHSLEAAAWCSSVGSIGNITGRLTMSFLSDRKYFNVRYGHTLGMFLQGSAILAFTFLEDYKFYVVTTFILGLGFGFAVALLVPAMIQVMGVEILPAVLGMSQLLQGISAVTLGIAAGAVKDASGNYNSASWLLAGCSYLGACLWILMPLAEKLDRRIYEKKEKEQQT